MDDYALILRLDISDNAPEGAGWYVYATGTGANGEQVLLRKPRRISGRHAMTLAMTMQHGDEEPTQDSPGSLPSQIVQSGNAKILQRINEQIAYAEDQARRIGQLRRILQTESETEGQVSD